MSTVSVRLPNGKIMKNVPKDATQEQIKDAAIGLGVATLEDFEKPSKAPEPVPAEPSVVTPPNESPRLGRSSVGARIIPDAGFLRENIDLPISMAGAATGAYIGSAAGPVGTFVGGMLGGAGGAFGGSLVSDDVKGEDLDFAKATEEALFSAGFDVATLGMGKFIKPAFVKAKKALGFTPEEAAKEIINAVPEVGTPESLKATQRILEGKGATLTPYQAGVEGFEVLKEKIARAGLYSSVKIEENAKLVNQAAADSMSEVVNRLSVNIDGDSEQIAEALFDVVEQGKKALSDNYSSSLDGILKEAATTRTPVKPFSKTLDNFVSSRQGEVVNELSDATIDYIEKLKSGFPDDPFVTVSLKELITIDKKLSKDISSTFGNRQSPLYNETVERELGMLSDELRETTYSLMQKTNPEVANKYKKLKGDFAAGRRGLLPEINRNFVTQASKGNYKSLGNLLTKAGNINQVVAFKKSLKEAFNQAGKTRDPSLGVFIDFDEADSLIKKGFLQRTFPDLGTGEFSIQKYKDLANRLSDKTEASKYKAVLGKDYPRVKQIINLMSEASEKPQSNLGELFLRNKELQAGAAAAGALGGAVTPLAPITASAAIFYPRILASAATNPKHVNKLIAYDKAKFASQEKAEAAAAVILSDIIDSMTEEEQAEFRNSIREGNQRNVGVNQ